MLKVVEICGERIQIIHKIYDLSMPDSQPATSVSVDIGKTIVKIPPSIAEHLSHLNIGGEIHLIATRAYFNRKGDTLSLHIGDIAIDSDQ